MNIITHAFNNTKHFIKKNSPTILLVTGLAASAGAMVTVSIASSKINKKLEEPNAELQALKDQRNSYKITEEEYKDLSRPLKLKAFSEITKSYWLPVTLWGISTACFIGGHTILSKRNAALVTAYTSLQSAYAAYRTKVKEKLGDKEEEKLHDEVIKEADGKYTDFMKFDVTKFNFMFDKRAEGWDPDGRANLAYLQSKEDYINKILRIKDYVTVYDVLFDQHMLALNPNTFSDDVINASKMFGWTTSHPTQSNIVSLGLTEYDGSQSIGAINMQKYGQDTFFVKFNTPYYIYEAIPKLMKKNNKVVQLYK